MSAAETSLTNKEEKVIKAIRDNEGINNTSIADITGYNNTKVHRIVSKLEDKELIKDSEWKNNKTSYKLKEGVELEKNYRLERIFNYQIAAHMLEMFLFASIVWYLPSKQYPLILLGFGIGFLPSFIHSISYAIEENDIHEIKVTKNSKDE